MLLASKLYKAEYATFSMLSSFILQKCRPCFYDVCNDIGKG